MACAKLTAESRAQPQWRRVKGLGLIDSLNGLSRGASVFDWSVRQPGSSRDRSCSRRISRTDDDFSPFKRPLARQIPSYIYASRSALLKRLRPGNSKTRRPARAGFATSYRDGDFLASFPLAGLFRRLAEGEISARCFPRKHVLRLGKVERLLCFESVTRPERTGRADAR